MNLNATFAVKARSWLAIWAGVLTLTLSIPVIAPTPAEAGLKSFFKKVKTDVKGFFKGKTKQDKSGLSKMGTKLKNFFAKVTGKKKNKTESVRVKGVDDIATLKGFLKKNLSASDRDKVKRRIAMLKGHEEEAAAKETASAEADATTGEQASPTVDAAVATTTTPAPETPTPTTPSSTQTIIVATDATGSGSSAPSPIITYAQGSPNGDYGSSSGTPSQTIASTVLVQ